MREINYTSTSPSIAGPNARCAKIPYAASGFQSPSKIHLEIRPEAVT